MDVGLLARRGERYPMVAPTVAVGAARRLRCGARVTRAAAMPLAAALNAPRLAGRASPCGLAARQARTVHWTVRVRARLLSAAQCRCRRTPAHGFAGTTEVLVDEHLGGAARWAVSGGGDLWGGEKRSGTRGSPAPQATDRREAMKRRRVQRRCERHRSRPCPLSIAAQSALSADRDSRSPPRVPPTAPRKRKPHHERTTHCLPADCPRAESDPTSAWPRR